jgi:hypothetical protein
VSGAATNAAALGGAEFPVHCDFALEIDLAALGQGTYEDQNPCAYHRPPPANEVVTACAGVVLVPMRLARQHRSIRV